MVFLRKSISVMRPK